MHIYFIGIGGAGLAPLALIASQAGYEVSGSDFKQSEYTDYLIKMGISVDIESDTSSVLMKKLHSEKAIEWVKGVSAIIRLKPDEAHLAFARKHGIRTTERDACLNEILATKNLKMIAAAGTHGKTTTTAMFVWVLKQLGIPVSYSIGAKTSFADMGHYEPGSEYFVYECDEFHRNFLSFFPYVSVISGIAWDHHEVFPTKDNYNQAFRDYIAQTKHTIAWDNDIAYIGLQKSSSLDVCASDNPEIESIMLAGLYNRRDAWLVVQAIHRLFGTDIPTLTQIISSFPGTQRRMEELTPGLFTDYAHTPEKIVGCMSVANELAISKGKNIVVVYEPLTNRRQHFMKNEYKDCFSGAEKVYWIPSYLAREDPEQAVLTPEELISHLSDPTIAMPASMNQALWDNIQNELEHSIVICMSGGGGNSLDEWLRAKAKDQALSQLIHQG